MILILTSCARSSTEAEALTPTQACVRACETWTGECYTDENSPIDPETLCDGCADLSDRDRDAYAACVAGVSESADTAEYGWDQDACRAAYDACNLPGTKAGD